MTKTTLAEPPEDDGDDRGQEDGKGRKGKRPYGEFMRDGIIRRGETWSYCVSVYDPKLGKKKPVWVGGFPTAEDAKAERDKARVKAREGNYVLRNRMTVGAYLTEWIDVHAAEVKPRTLDSYRWLIQRYVIPHLGEMRLQDVRPATITRFYLTLKQEGGQKGRPLSARTVDYVHAVLRKAFRDAVIVEQLLSTNPVERAKRPRRERHEPGNVWTKAQLRTFLQHARKHRLGPFFHLAAYTGARRGELLFLRWSAVDLDRREIAIRGSTGYISGQRIQGTTKTGRSRTVSIDQTTADVLKAHRAVQDAERQALDMKPTKPDDFLFANEAGEQIHPDTVSSLMARLIHDYNDPPDGDPPTEPLPKARLHDLRHLHATMLLLAKVPVHVVARRLGHQDPSVTLRVYAHVINDRSLDVSDVFEATLEEDDEAPD